MIPIPSQRGHRHNEALSPPDQVARVLKDWFDLPHSHALGQVLFIGQDEQRHAAQVIIANHFVKHCLRLAHPFAVIRVDHVDQGMALLVVLEWN